MEPLDAHIRRLADQGHLVGLHPATSEGWLAYVIVRNHPLPSGYSKAESDVLVKIPLNYPLGAPDMFWTDEDLRLVGGGLPENADVREQLVGRAWQRFSWHPAGGWEPGRSDLGTYLGFVDTRLEQRR